MSSSFKGLVSVIISIFFFFPFIWSRILYIGLNIKLSTYPVLVIGLITAIIAIIFGLQARKGGSSILGTIGITFGIISVVLNIVNLIAVIFS